MIKLMRVLSIFLLFTVLFSVGKAFADFDNLNKKDYEKSKGEKAIIIYGVNWGRKWGCGGVDNAQLQNITFMRTGSRLGEEISLNNPGKLLSKDVSKPYAIIIEPGEYELIGFDIRLAKSSQQIEHLKWEGKGQISDGVFNVNPGEVVYIGDFGLDCAEQPILWRYYIQKEDFESYISGFKEQYKFVADEVIYRIFKTDKFGVSE